MTRRVITYGFDGSRAMVSGHGMTLEAFGSRCRVVQTTPDGTAAELGELRLRVPGRHNLLNALAAVAVGLEVSVPFGKIARGLEQFRGAERRFERRGAAPRL